MTAVIMDGKVLAVRVEERLKSEVESIRRRGVEPTLATILVGDDEASRVYVGRKHKAAARVGIRLQSYTLGENTTETGLVTLINELNRDREVNGILLQFPLPDHLNRRTVIDQISTLKDVDGLTSSNVGLLAHGEAYMVPCTPKGIMYLLHSYQTPIESATAVIINRSTLVGKPLFYLLLNENATVTTCHSKSKDLASITERADILVTAVGRRPEFSVTGDMVKEGATVIDVAMNRIDGRLMGDVEFNDVCRKASRITPVPGGVGPMTVVMLLENTILATARQNNTVVPMVLQQ